jgi:putative ABC transport system ATP-binding protein
MIQLKEIEKVYRTDRIETVALAEVNLTVAEGEFISVMGPSGCGKSTLLNLMGLLDAPTKGTVQINGSAIASYTDRAMAALRNRDIGFVFQVFHLVTDLSVLDNVQIPPASSSGWPSPGRLSASRGSSSPTSPPATSTRRWATRS